MTDSLRDQLLGLGFKPAAKPDRPAKPPRREGGEGGKRAGREGVRRGPGDVPAATPRDAARPGERRPGGGRGGKRPEGRPGAGAAPRSREDIDLAKAYAIRAQREKQERIDAERAKQDEARLRREAKARFAEFVQGKALNVPDADIARHFDYGGKIKRVYVTAEQLKALNRGEIGVAQLDGRYLLLPADVLAAAGAIFPPAIALKVDPDAPVDADPYADPQYQVPDDLVW